MKNILSKLKNEKGQSAVEFALVAILLLLLVFGIIEFGRAWYHADVLKGDANIAARTYAVSGSVAGNTMATSLIADSLLNNKMTITIAYTCKDDSGNPVDCNAITAPLPTSVTASVTEMFNTMVPGLLPMLNPIMITRTATYRME